MASPIGHSLFGIAIAALFYPHNITLPRNRVNKECVGYFLVAIILANVPDLDFLPGFFVNNPGIYHHMATHSIFSALVISPILAIVICMWRQWPLSLPMTSLLVLMILLSHLLADYVAEDGSYPHGMMALWPFDDGWYISPIILLGPVIKGPVGTDIFGFFQAMLTPVNIRTILRELWVGGILLICVIIFRNYKGGYLR